MAKALKKKTVKKIANKVIKKAVSSKKKAKSIKKKVTKAVLKKSCSCKKSSEKSDLKELNNYLELISPITTKFVTKKELEDIIENKMADQMKWSPKEI